MNAPRRIRVLGAAGSGKTTTARAIAERLGYPVLEVDSVFWLPGWQERPDDDFRNRLRNFADQPEWVIDGNYSGRIGTMLDDLTDLHVWLDVPRWRACLSVARRTIRRSRSKEDLWGTGNRERISSLLKTKPLDNLVIWSWKQTPRYRARWSAAMAADPHRWVRLRSRRQIGAFIASLSSGT